MSARFLYFIPKFLILFFSLAIGPCRTVKSLIKVSTLVSSLSNTDLS